MSENALHRDNQQATPTDAEVAWLAGLIEGEGSLMLTAWARDEKGAPHSLKVSANIVLYNTDGGIIEQALNVLEALQIPFYVKEREQKPMMRPGGGHYMPTAPMLSVLVKTMPGALRLLQRLSPWLYGEKAARARIMIRFLERRLAKIVANDGNYRNVKMDAEDLRCVSEFYGLTKAGRSPAVERVLNELERHAP